MKLYIYRSKGLYINKIWGWEREREWDWGTEDNLSDDDPSEIIDVDNQDESINQHFGIPNMTFTNPSQIDKTSYDGMSTFVKTKSIFP